MSKTVKVIIGIIVLVLVFYAGAKYDQHVSASARSSRAGAFAGRTGAAGAAGMRGGNTIVMGTILSSDGTSITLQNADGSGSTIAFLTASTTVMDTSVGSTSDLSNGATVTVIGTKNSDGSLSINSIQVKQ